MVRAVPVRLAVAALALAVWLGAAGPVTAANPNGIVVYETDFGLKDGAVASMKGVARTIERDLILEDLTHEVPAFDIWTGAYWLNQTIGYWPPGTVFVVVVDPGVGTDVRSVVALTGAGHYVVTPDNGTLTLVADQHGIAALREIDKAQHQRPGSEQSYTFFGRDLYSLTGARIAAGQAAFETVGPELDPKSVVRIDYARAQVVDGAAIGVVPVLDVQFGNVWSNIGRSLFAELGVAKGSEVGVTIFDGDSQIFEGRMPFVDTFGDVPEGKPLLYVNSLDNMAVAINFGDFAGTHGIGSGPEWRMEIRP
jgi:S-adenosylmethionine hydrolase